MKAISIPLAAYFVTVLPWVIMASDEPFSFLGRVNEFLPYLATGAVLLYITAHCIDLNYLRLKSGVLPWIFELFGAILFVPVGILLIIAVNDMFHDFNDTYWVVVASLESAALLLIAIAKLISGIRSRKA
jgi:branched-subunit amino acid transport protein AzlD